MSRSWYEVRVREASPSYGEMKKSRFYFARGPGDAASHYKGKGLIMWARSVSREKSLGIGDFFSLGDKLLKELRRGNALEEISTKKEMERVKTKNKRFSARERKKRSED